MGAIFPGSSTDSPVKIDGTGLQAMAPFSPIIGLVTNPGPGVLYTVPKGFKSVIASIELYNNSGVTPANVAVTLNTNGTDYPISGAALNNLDRLADTLPRTLPPGSIIKASSDQNNVTYLVQVLEVAQ